MIAAMLVAASNGIAQCTAQSIDIPVVDPKWTGVWQGTLGGVPAVMLTLADDAGEPNGTIVFHAIKNDHGHAYAFSKEPHTLTEPRIGGGDGNTISFPFRRGNGSCESLNMSVDLGEVGNVHFTWSNCGAEGTKADLMRMHERGMGSC